MDEDDFIERNATQYVLKNNFFVLLLSLLRIACINPRRTYKAVRTSIKMSRKADKSPIYHVFYLLEAAWIACFMQSKGFDHIHAHFGTNPAEVGSLVSLLTGVPFSFTVHGPEEFDRPEALHLREKAAVSRFVVAVSSYGKSQIFRWVSYAHWSKVNVVHCGVDDIFLKSAITAPADRNKIVCVGRLTAQKGQLLLLEAASQLVRDGHKFELVLAGDGEMRGEIERYISEMNLSAHVSITGWIDAARVRSEIISSRALVLPSFAEGLPVVIMEAMALARPVITTYIAGIPELVQDGKNGWLVPAGDISALKHAMLQCLQADPQQLFDMGLNGRARVLSEHNAHIEASKLADLIRPYTFSS